MTDQSPIEARKAAAAAGATDNSAVGVDGDDPSVADTDGSDHTTTDETAPAEGPPDPVTGSTTNAVGEQQAAENEDEEQVG